MRSEFYYSVSEVLKRQGLIEKLILLVLAGSFALVALYNLAVPLTWHDPIVHTVVAKLLFRDLSAALYPFAEADPETGFYQEGNHPLGFPASKIIFMLFDGDGDTPWHKPMSAIYYLYLVVAVGACAARAFGARTVAYASMLIAATPRLFLSALIVHIDPLRVYGYFIGFAFLMEFLRSKNMAWLLASAIGVAMGLHVHAGNILIVPFILILYFLLSSEPICHRFRNAFVLGGLVAAISAGQYINNFVRYGTPVTSGYTLETIPEFRVKNWETIRRDVETPLDALIKGTLAPFTDFENFGATPWFGLLGLLILAAGMVGRWRMAPEASLIILSILIYFGLGLLAVALGVVSAYKNPRYALIVLPFLALAGSLFCVRFVDWTHSNLKCAKGSDPNLAVSTAILSFAVLCPLAIYAAQSWTSVGYVVLSLPVLAVTLGQAWMWLVRRSEQPVLERWVKNVGIAVAMVITFAIPLRFLWASTIAPSLLIGFWSLDRISRSDLEKVLGAPGYAPAITGVAAATREVGTEGTVLTFQDEIYYYGQGRFVSEYDKRLQPFYQAKNISDAKMVLETLGVRYFYIPSYYTPGMSHPNFQHILADYKRITIAHQAGSTLLAYNELPRNIVLTSIVDIRFPEGLEVTRDRRWVYPADLGRCYWFSAVTSGMLEWYKTRFDRQPISPACQSWNDDRNWLRMGVAGATYRLILQTRDTGCATALVFYKQKTGQSWTTGAASMDFTSMQEQGEAVQYFRPPADADGLALAVAKSCAMGSHIMRIQLDELVETVRPPESR